MNFCNLFRNIDQSKKHSFLGNASRSCKENWEKHEDSCFFWSKERLSWTDAEEFCSSQGGHLASVTSNATNEYILKKIESMPWNIGNPYQRQLWVGGFYEEKAGEWEWSDASPWKFTNWMPNQPSNHSKQRCVKYSGPSGWKNVYCYLKIRFLCNMELQPGKISGSC